MSTSHPGPDGSSTPSGSGSTLGAGTAGIGSADAAGSHSSSVAEGSHPAEDRSLGDIVGDIAKDLGSLIRQELDLAKREAKTEASKAGKGAGLLGGAAVTALLMLIFTSLALTYLLDNVMPVELAALLVALLWAIATGVLAMSGKKQLQNVNPSLETTQRSLKEDAQWARTQKSS